jgi:hypothetical protein
MVHQDDDACTLTGELLRALATAGAYLSHSIMKQQSSIAFKLLQSWAYFDNQDVWFSLLPLPLLRDPLSLITPLFKLKLLLNLHVLLVLFPLGLV